MRKKNNNKLSNNTLPSASSAKEKVTEEELNLALNFAYNYLDYSKGYTSTANYPAYGLNINRALTPDLVNSRLKAVNNNYMFKSPEEIENLLKNTNSNETLLRNLAIGLEIESLVYKRLISFNSDLLAYNLTWDCYNLEDMGYDDSTFLSDLNILKTFIQRFDFKSNFSMCHRLMLRQGAVAVSVRDDFEKIVLQELPLDFTEIIGRDDYGLVFAFNFAWFIQNYGTDINMYKDVFRKMYLKIYEKMGNTYVATDSNSTYMYWENCNRKDGFWYFKPQIEITTLIPYYSGIFPVLASQPTVRKLQYNKNIIAATKILVGNIQMLKEQKAGNVTNQTAFSSKSIGEFLGNLRAGIAKEIGIGVIPSDDVTAVDFSVQDKNIYEEQTGLIANQAASSSASLFSTDKLSLFESKVALDIDSNFAKSFYDMFSKFVEYQINSKTTKYKFKITFNDTNTSVDEEKRMKNFNDLAKVGIVRWDLLARALNEDVFSLERQMKYSNSLKLEKYLIPLMNVYNQANKEDVGRSPNSNPDSDNTAISQERGTNELK